MQNLTLSKIHQQQTILIVRGEISQNETRWSDDGAIDSAITLLAKAWIFSTQF
jgi:hypothetical protein